MKKTALAAAMCLLAVPATAEMSYDDFMGDVGAAQQQIDYSGQLVKRSELDKWILEGKKGEAGQDGEAKGESSESSGAAIKKEPDAWLPDAMKPDGQTAENTPAANASADPAGKVETKPRSRPRRAVGEEESGADRGAAPAGRAEPTDQDRARSAANWSQQEYRGKNKGVTYVYVPETMDSEEVKYEMGVERPEKTIRYGIAIGTKFRVELKSGASSVQPGYTQVVLLEDVVGSRKTLQRGAVLFLEMDAVRGAERLFGRVVKGIERNRRDEFSLSGNIYADDGQPGLIGKVISDGRGLDRATDAGLAAAASAALNSLPGTNLGLDAGKRAGESLLGEEDNTKQTARGVQRLVVQAGPQTAFVQIEETF